MSCLCRLCCALLHAAFGSTADAAAGDDAAAVAIDVDIDVAAAVAVAAQNSSHTVCMMLNVSFAMQVVVGLERQKMARRLIT